MHASSGPIPIGSSSPQARGRGQGWRPGSRRPETGPGGGQDAGPGGGQGAGGRQTGEPDQTARRTRWGGRSGQAQGRSLDGREGVAAQDRGSPGPGTHPAAAAAAGAAQDAGGPDHRLALTIGDASGKGLAAALMMSNVQSSLRTATLFTGNEAAAALTAVNRQVYASSLANRYATLFYGIFDGAARTLRYVNAGHNPPMVMRRDGSQ